MLGDDSAAVAKAAAKGATALFKQAFVYVSNAEAEDRAGAKPSSVPTVGEGHLESLEEPQRDLRPERARRKPTTARKCRRFGSWKSELCFLCTVQPSISANHALLNPDDVATECDSLLGVLLECLKPDAHAQAIVALDR